MTSKEESEKVGLKFNIQKTKIMASGPITSWQIDGETVETVRDFILRALTGSSWHCICQASLPMVIRSSFKLWLVSSSLYPLIRYLFSFYSTKSEIVRRYLGDRDREA